MTQEHDALKQRLRECEERASTTDDSQRAQQQLKDARRLLSKSEAQVGTLNKQLTTLQQERDSYSAQLNSLSNEMHTLDLEQSPQQHEYMRNVIVKVKYYQKTR